MLILGLTGSIGMGKSTVAAMLRRRGCSVCDADREVHKLYEGAAVPLIEAAFPGTTEAGKVDRQRLAAALGRDATAFARLEAIVHPLVRAAERAFLVAEHARHAALAVLEIPLLFETGGDALVDVTIVVSAPAEVQRERVLARGGMTAEKLAALLERQLPDAVKRARADFVVDTGGTLAATEAQVDKILAQLGNRQGRSFERSWSGLRADGG